MPCSRELLEQVDYWVLNEVELALYGGETVPPHDHDALTALALRTRVQHAQTMVVTLGRRGLGARPAESEQAVFIPHIGFKRWTPPGQGIVLWGHSSPR
jgi:sugar/nucleoside kinase (ribokinase family)